MKHKKSVAGFLKEQGEMYGKKPGSALMMLLVWGSALITFGALFCLMGYVFWKGIFHLKPSLFAITYTTENASLFPALINTLEMIGLALVVAIPLGVGAAIYLVEYAKKDSRFVDWIRLTTETLTGIPSIIYGLFGMLFFVSYLDWGFSLLSGSCTLSIMVLPLILRTTEEALKSVPDAYREGSFGLGAGKIRTIFAVILPSAGPGILSGIILATGRIVGETAALIYTAGTVPHIAKGILHSGRTLAVHMYSLASEGLYMDQAYATAVVLLVFVLGINSLSVFVAKKLMKDRG